MTEMTQDTGDSSREEAGLAEAGAGVSATGPVGNEFAPDGGDELRDDVDRQLAGDDETADGPN